MVKKALSKYVCNNCGAISATWAGRCYQCSEWNTLAEQVEVDTSSVASTGISLKAESVKTLAAKRTEQRIASGLGEVDMVMGGGFVAGSVSLIAGQPGIGKSTLLLQLADKTATKYPVLYVSGEESAHQIGLRAKRLGTGQPKLQLATSTNADDIAATIAGRQYKLVIVDSIQAVTTSAVSSSSGTVSQISGSTQLLTAAAKQTGTAIMLVGHVTKEGSIAGPKILEHVVDVVLQLEGERYGGLRVLRGVKNRYGSTNETGIFEMSDNGLSPVANPSATLLAERQVSDGSVVLATMEGTRPLLVEVQALVNRTSFGYPKRASSGVDLNRVNLLVAMLERRTKLNLSEHDIYVNIVGGIRIGEPAADLAVCMAIASAARGMQLKKDAVVFGEVGLSGEVRHVPFADKRIAEAKKLGFVGAIGPIIKNVKKSGFYGVRDIRNALNQFLEKD